MTVVRTSINRRSFLKVSAITGGGMMLSFSWLAGCNPTAEEALALPKEWFELNAFVKIGENGVVTLICPNPEFGQNVKTSMPMILAEELDVDWKKVIVEMADYIPERFERQFTGGSQSIRQGWKPLRTAGATARQLLVNAAADTWKVPAQEITTETGFLFHKASGKKAGYGEMASVAAKLPVPEKVTLKNVRDFKIIGTSKKNVDAAKIVTGKPMYGIDEQREGMRIAMIVHPPAFGLKLKSVDGASVKNMPGIRDVFTIQTLSPDFVRNAFDTATFTELAVIVGDSTWEVMNAKKALKVEWEKIAESKITVDGWGGRNEVKIPAGLESTVAHKANMNEWAQKPARILRKDGDPEKAFAKAAKVIERTYSAPFLAHNCMEPMNFFADVTADKAVLAGPIQAPEFIRKTVSARLGLPLENIEIELLRMGGGFGRRAYGHYILEAALISQQAKAPVKLMYTREDDMSYGIYRPAYTATYRAALDEKNQLIAFHVKGGGVPETPVAPNRFPAGAVDNYLAEGWQIDSNITIGAFRAPRSNFIASAEQSFLDELAEAMGKDPIAMRLELLERARTNPVGKDNDYDAARYAGVLELVREKSKWSQTPAGVHRGVSAYFCHNSYVAEVLDIVMKDNAPVIEKVVAAVDCGIVINKDAAANMGEGAIVDGIGNALYGEMTFRDGMPEKTNLDAYRIIRQREAPRSIEVHFVENDIDPTGLGEPLFPPIFAALANSLYRATGKRFYSQPFQPQIDNKNSLM